MGDSPLVIQADQDVTVDAACTAEPVYIQKWP